MLGKLLSLVTGGSGPLILIGALLLATNAGTAWVTHKVDQSALESLQRRYAEQAAADNAKALAQLQAHDAAVNKALTELAQERDARAAEVQSLRNRIKSVPKTRACVDSPAIRALVDGLRKHGSNDRH